MCGYGVVPVPAASTLAHGMSRDVLVDVDPGMDELSIVIAYTSCGLWVGWECTGKGVGGT